MTFYQECLGGKLEMMTVGDSPVANQMPTEAKDKSMHATLTNGSLALMASDMMGPGGSSRGIPYTKNVRQMIPHVF